MSFLRGIKKGIEEFSSSITIIVNSVLLLALYIVGVGGTSLAAKLVGKKFLQSRLGDKTYWSELNLKKKPLEEYYRQF
jgi:hypothetical protein